MQLKKMEVLCQKKLPTPDKSLKELEKIKKKHCKSEVNYKKVKTLENKVNM